VKGFWVPGTGVLSLQAFEKGTEWSRTDAELPVQAKLVVAYGRLRKEEADRRNRAHAAAAAEAAPKGCRVNPQLLLDESLQDRVGRVVKSVRGRFGACWEWEEDRERKGMLLLRQAALLLHCQRGGEARQRCNPSAHCGGKGVCGQREDVSEVKPSRAKDIPLDRLNHQLWTYVAD